MDFSAFSATGAFPSDRRDFFFGHIRPDGNPWSFAGHEYLEALVADEAPVIDVLKGAQLGVSTVAIGRCLHDASRGLTAAHFLPNRALMHIFVQERVDPIINDDEALARAVIEGKSATSAVSARLRAKGGDNTRRKQFGRGSLFYQGLQKETDVKTFSYDEIVFDELDELNPDLVPWLKDRLLHSPYARRFALSQPSVPDFGIHAAFLAGDQKYFLLQCTKCRRWCNLQDDWPDCLHLAGQTVVSARGKARTVKGNHIVCKRCGTPISIRKSAGHEWVAKCPDHGASSSYSLSQLYGPFCDADKIASRFYAAQKSRAELASLTVSVVGLPHAGDRQPINDEVLADACGDWQCGPPAVLDVAVPASMRQRPLRLAGIDTGDVLHAVAAEVIPVVAPTILSGCLLVFDVKVFSGETQWGDLARWLLDRGVTFFVVDAAPYTTNSKALCRTTGLHGALCRFTGTDLVHDYEERQHPHPVGVVKRDRTEAIDALADALAARAMLLPSPRLDIMGIVKKHCKALVKDLQPTGKYAYKKGVANHFGLALTYLQLARQTAEMLNLGPVEPFGSPESHLIGDSFAVRDW